MPASNKYPPYSEVILCPALKCEWEHVEPDPLGLRPTREDIQNLIRDGVPGLARARAQRIEAALAEHIDTHTALDWLQTIWSLKADRSQGVTLLNRLLDEDAPASDIGMEARAYINRIEDFKLARLSSPRLWHAGDPEPADHPPIEDADGRTWLYVVEQAPGLEPSEDNRYWLWFQDGRRTHSGRFSWDELLRNTEYVTERASR
jgi:hypothetical protein